MKRSDIDLVTVMDVLRVAEDARDMLHVDALALRVSGADTVTVGDSVQVLDGVLPDAVHVLKVREKLSVTVSVAVADVVPGGFCAGGRMSCCHDGTRYHRVERVCSRGTRRRCRPSEAAVGQLALRSVAFEVRDEAKCGGCTPEHDWCGDNSRSVL